MVTDERRSYLSALDEEDDRRSRRRTRRSARTAASRATRSSAREHGEFQMVRARRDHDDGRLAEAARLGRGLADPVPRERRREPRADGLEHAAAGACRCCAREAPLVGTGMEARGRARLGRRRSSRKRDGVVETVDAAASSIKPDETTMATGSNVDIINLIKYQRSNQNTCINQKPIVRAGDRVGSGRRDRGRPGHRPRRARARPERARRVHAVGRVQLRGLDPHLRDAWSRTTSSPRSTSRSSRCVARDTKLGKEDITRDIPNVGEEALADLDEAGIVRIGAEVQPDDILVGKITPKGETQLSPEERLLRAIFGEKAGDVRDTSLRVPPGVTGIVIGAQVFSRRGIDKDDRGRSITDAEIAKLAHRPGRRDPHRPRVGAEAREGAAGRRALARCAWPTSARRSPG